ncbi:MAG: Ig-like domain-containing protein [bacterium]
MGVSDFATNYDLFANTLIGSTADIPHDPTTDVMLFGYYVATQGFGDSPTTRAKCFWDALSFISQAHPDWVTVGKRITACGDLTAAAEDIGSILIGGDVSADATRLAALVRAEMDRGRAVILVGHSRGTLVAQQALQLIRATPVPTFDAQRCIGFVSVASPLYEPTGWGPLLANGTIAEGKYTGDLMLTVARTLQKAPSVSTNYTDDWDRGALGGSPRELSDVYHLVAGYYIHSWSSYVSGIPVASFIRNDVKAEAAILQRTCAPILTVASPTVKFSTPTGGTPASQQVEITNGGTRTLDNLSATVTYGSGASSGWLSTTLSETTAPATLTLRASAAGLAAGTYTATVAVRSGAVAVTNSPQTVTVTLTVSDTPAIGVSPSAITFAAVLGSTQPSPQTITISNAGSGTLGGLGASVTYPAGSPTGWLNAQMNGTTAPATATLAAAQGGLAVGTYHATVIVTSTASGVTNAPQSVPVTLTVAASTAPSIAAVRVSPTSATITVGATQQLTASGVDAQGNPVALGAVTWTSGSPSVASVSSGGLVTALSAGAAMITAAASGRSGTASVTVTQPPTGSAPSITTSQTSAGFNLVFGAANPPPSTVSISNGGTGMLNGLFLYGINYVQFNSTDPTGWLSASLSSTTAPSTLTLSVNASGVPVGTWSAVVSVGSTAAGLVGGPRNITVTLTVTNGPPAPAKLTLSPTEYAIKYASAPPGVFTFAAELCNTGGQPYSWTASSTSSLVRVSPTSGTVDRVCQNVTVTGDATGIPSGITLLGVLTFTPNPGTALGTQNWINIKAEKP